jgi:hypothetical protein
MNLNFLEEDNVTLSLKYFHSLHKIYTTFLEYIKQYQFISVEYHQKLILLNTTYKTKIYDISRVINEKLDFSVIFDFINTIPKIIDSYIENLLFFNEEVSKHINIFEDKSIEQIILTCESQFEDFKKDLKNQEEEINNLKNEFFSEMEKTEIKTYDYYFLEPKYNMNIPEKYKTENIITENEMNKKIIDTKELENRYKEKINEGRKKEKKFIENSKFHCENIKKFTNELMEKIKKLVLNFLMALKNNFKLPEIEINSYLPKLIKLNESIKLDEMMQQKFKNKKIEKFLFNPEIYEMIIFKNKKKDKESKIIIEEIEDKISKLEDGLGFSYLINDEISYLTIKRMKLFELINIKDLDLIKESEKIKMFQLTLKLFSNIKKDETEINNDINIEQKDIELIESFLKKHHCKIVFLQKLSKFRVKGNYYLNKKMFEIFSKFFNHILNDIKEDDDVFSAKNIIVLSQTYYTKENDKKIYLQEDVKNHDIFKNINFWEKLFNFFIEKETQKYKNSKDINEINENNIEDNNNNYSKIAYGQIMTICNNMIEFGLNKNDIYKVIEPKIKYYKLDEDLINNIKCVLEFDNQNNS